MSRIHPTKILADVDIFPSVALMILSYLFIFGTGYYNFDLSFFTIHHWIESRGLFYFPLIGFPIVVLFLLWTTWNVIDLFLSKNCYLGLIGDDLVLRGRILIPNFRKSSFNIFKTKNGKFVVLSGENGSSVKIPVIDSKQSADFIVNSLESIVER